jgi:hypothetical protein
MAYMIVIAAVMAAVIVFFSKMALLNAMITLPNWKRKYPP